ncbi:MULTISPECIES: conjugative transfer protein MobI(A/C) [unclassified Halomonas]|uniref:conjugative transfer protein MobI(A/C) n=1 Tax=unclassified Halomonas TaxID=2609666 RepID=UPI0040341909
MDIIKSAEKTHSELYSMRDSLAAELDRIRNHAQIICDLHWENVREEAGRRAPRFITRIRVTTGSLQCQWLRAGGKPPSEPGGRIMATLVPKGTSRFNPRYKQSAFNSAEPWEREIIDETEINYAMLRERYMAISKIKNDLDKTIGLTKKSFERIGFLWDQ